MNAAGHPVNTGKLLGGQPAGHNYVYPFDPAHPDTSPDMTDAIGNWAAVKHQALTKLGFLLTDKDVLNVPMVASDPYGNFVPGPLRGLPQYVTKTGLVEGNLASPVPVPANVVYLDTPFLTDIAHNADPSTVPGSADRSDGHSDAGCRLDAVCGLRASAGRHLRR